MKQLFFILSIFFFVLSFKTVEQTQKSEEAFTPFLKKFEQDSNFQISRVVFPLLRKEFNVENHDTIQKWIQKKDYQNINLTSCLPYSTEFRNYKNKIIMEVRGLENGKIIDFHFSKKAGKWMLIEWSDFSSN
jgi:hypothetical protein